MDRKTIKLRKYQNLKKKSEFEKKKTNKKNPLKDNFPDCLASHSD